MARKNNENSYIDSLEQKNRELKAEIRRLTKRLARIGKGYRKYLDKDTEAEKTETSIQEKSRTCFKCGKGTMELTTILNRRWRTCTICGHKTSVKIINSDGTYTKVK
jgi:predicted RNase H-like nuclease (RuvC/YqgF family)